VTVDQLEPQLFGVLARVAKQGIGNFDTTDLANIAWAFAAAGHLDEKLFLILARVTEFCMPNFSDSSALSKTFLALSQVENLTHAWSLF